MLDYFFTLKNVHAVAYQPIVELATGELDRVRVPLPAARCRGSRRRSAAIVQAAIDTGRTIELDAFIVRVILERVGRAPGRRAGRPASRPLHLAINFTPASLLDPPVRGVGVRRRWSRRPASTPRQITLECTEQQAVSDIAPLVKQVKALRRLGFGFAIDDAGAGYASFTLIAALRPSVIKIDREIASGIARDDAKQALVEAFVSFGGRIGALLARRGDRAAGRPRDADRARRRPRPGLPDRQAERRAAAAAADGDAPPRRGPPGDRPPRPGRRARPRRAREHAARAASPPAGDSHRDRPARRSADGASADGRAASVGSPTDAPRHDRGAAPRRRRARRPRNRCLAYHRLHGACPVPDPLLPCPDRPVRAFLDAAAVRDDRHHRRRTARPARPSIWYRARGRRPDPDQQPARPASGRPTSQRDGRVSLAVLGDGRLRAGSASRGHVDAVDDDPARALADIQALARRYHPDGADPADLESYRAYPRITFRIAIDRVHDHLED